MDNHITLDALQAALARCMAIHPPTGAERRLHPDANRLADLFGLMVYERTPAVRHDAVPADIVEIYSRWRGPMAMALPVKEGAA
jgi:hypothetical protein